MPIRNPAKNCDQPAGQKPISGPRLAFFATVAVAGLVIASGTLPDHLLMPVIGTLLFVLAMVFALVAWIRCSTDEYDVTYWDVAGAVAFIGICTAALVEPDQLVRIVEATH